MKDAATGKWREVSLALLLLCVASLARAQVSVNALLTDGTGSAITTGFLHFELENCGNNNPVLANNPGLFQNPWTVVRTAFDMHPNQPDGSIVGQVLANDQLLCGNVASTYYMVTPMKDDGTPLSPVGGQPFVICSSSAPFGDPCSNSPGGSWNPALAQPAFQPIAPGFSQVFQNPVVTQTWTQPAGTKGIFIGAFDFSQAVITGFTVPAGAGSPSGSVQGNKLGAITAIPSSSFDFTTGFVGFSRVSASYTSPYTGTLFQNGLIGSVNGCSPQTEYQIPSGSGGFQVEGVTGCNIVPVGAVTAYQAAGVAGYVDNSSTTIQDAIAVEGIDINRAAGTSTHAASFVTSDMPGIANANYAAELFSIAQNVGSTPVGLLVQSDFIAQPTTAAAIQIASNTVSNTFWPWGMRFETHACPETSATGACILFNPVSSASNSNSQGALFVSNDSGTIGGVDVATMVLTAGGNFDWTLSKPGGALVTNIFQANDFITLSANPASTGVYRLAASDLGTCWRSSLSAGTDVCFGKGNSVSDFVEIVGPTTLDTVSSTQSLIPAAQTGIARGSNTNYVSLWHPPSTLLGNTTSFANSQLVVPAWSSVGNNVGVYYGAAGKTGHGDLVQIVCSSCGGSSYTFQNIGQTGVPSGANPPNAGSNGGTSNDGVIIWSRVGIASSANNEQPIVTSDFWNYVNAQHDALGNIVKCNATSLLPTIGWNAFDTGTTAPSISYTTLDGVLKGFVDDPSFCPQEKLVLLLSPIQSAGTQGSLGGSSTPVYPLSPTWAATAEVDAWQAATQYTWGWTIKDNTTHCSGGPCYQTLTSQGSAAVCTSSAGSGGAPTGGWTAGTAPQTTTEGGGTGPCVWTSSATAVPQQVTYCANTGTDSGFAWTMSGLSNTLTALAAGTIYGVGNANSTGLTAADASTGLPWIGGTPFVKAWANALHNAAGTGYHDHYNAAQWNGIFAYMRNGIGDGGQTTPKCPGEWITASGTTTGPTGTWYPLWEAILERVFRTYAAIPTNGYSIQTSPQSNSSYPSAVDSPVVADALAAYLATGGPNGGSLGVGPSWGGLDYATDVTHIPQQQPTNGDWATNTQQWYHQFPNISVQMVGETGGGSTCAGAGNGTLPQNMNLAAQWGVRSYELLDPDYFRAFDPNHPDYVICGAPDRSAIGAFLNGQSFQQPPFSVPGAKPQVSTTGLVQWPGPTQISVITPGYTNATTGFTSLTLTPGIYVGINQSLTADCELIYQNTGNTIAPAFKWTGPSGATLANASAVFNSTVSTTEGASAVGFSTAMDPGVAVTTNTNFPVRITLDVVNGVTQGQIALQAALHASGGTLTIASGSCRVN